MPGIDLATATQVEEHSTVNGTGPSVRVAHLTSVHSAFDVRIFHKECVSLAAAGYEVILIAPHDKFETVLGVRIEPVAKAANRRSRMTKTVWQVYRKARRSRACLFHFHDPELLPVGFFLKLSGKLVVYDAHERVADDILTKDWISPGIRKAVSLVVGAFESLTTRIFDAVVGATPCIAEAFPKEKAFLLRNFPLAGESATKKEIPYCDREQSVVYVGSITEMKGAREMVRAMGHFPSHVRGRLVLVGDIESAEVRADLECSPGWERVEYVGLQERTAVSRFTGSARAGLVLFHPLPNYEDAEPNKLFEYMSAGLPVIASNFEGWRAIVEEIGCGLLVNPLNPAEIADAITWILDHPSEAESMGKRGKEAVSTKYNWKTQETRLLRLYKDLLNPL